MASGVYKENAEVCEHVDAAAAAGIVSNCGMLLKDCASIDEHSVA